MKKKLKIKFNAPAVLTFVFLSLIATLLGLVTKGSSTRLVFMTYRSPIDSAMTYVRLFTHVLGHNSLAHFIGNASYLLLLGPMLEEKYGSRVMVELFVITALLTGLLNSLLFPHAGLCGASGIAFAFILLASFTGYHDGEIPLTFILVALFYLGQQIYDMIFVADNISNITHIVGGLIGMGVGFLLNKIPEHPFGHHHHGHGHGHHDAHGHHEEPCCEEAHHVDPCCDEVHHVDPCCEEVHHVPHHVDPCCEDVHGGHGPVHGAGGPVHGPINVPFRDGGEHAEPINKPINKPVNGPLGKPHSRNVDDASGKDSSK